MKFGGVTTDHKWLQLPDELTARYNHWDCYNTARLVPKVENQLDRAGNRDFFTDYFWPLVPVVTDMQRRGVGYLDREVRNSLRRKLRSEIAQLEKDILDGTDPTNYTDKLFNSPKQLAKLLFDEWGLPKAKPTRKNPSGRSTDLAALGGILSRLRKRDEPYRLRLYDLFHHSRLQTILERYLVVEGDPDGRVRPTIKLGGTETGRFAYAGGPGEAIQQWPPEVRGLIRAAPGCVFVARDYSQLEARILAILAQDRVSLAAFAEGRDVHLQNTLDLFGFSQAQFDQLPPKNKVAFRNFAKVFLYGLSYGGKADSIKMKLFCPCARCTHKAPPQVNLSKLEVVRAASRWEQIHWPVMEWRAKLVESVYGHGQDRTWTSPFGWRRRLWEPRSLGERSLMNLPMQHCASQIINRVMVRLHSVGVPLVLQMHDELVIECKLDEADEMNELLKETMEMKVPELGGAVFPTSGAVGERWSDLK